MQKEFEKVLAFHCGPSLAGIKTANLISLSARKFPELSTLISQYSQILEEKGICLEQICGCSSGGLFLVYRERLLYKRLEEEQVKRFLKTLGYPSGASLDTTITHLKTRLSSHAEFLHEIGIFLGYPIEDVIGFQENQGRNYIFSGHWKVYSDAEQAKKCFKQYDKCRSSLCKKIENGISIAQLFRAS